MNYQGFFSKRFFTMMAAAGVIALAPLSRADAHGYLQTNLVTGNTAAMADFSRSKPLKPLGSCVLPRRPVLDLG